MNPTRTLWLPALMKRSTFFPKHSLTAAPAGGAPAAMTAMAISAKQNASEAIAIRVVNLKSDFTGILEEFLQTTKG